MTVIAIIANVLMYYKICVPTGLYIIKKHKIITDGYPSLTCIKAFGCSKIIRLPRLHIAKTKCFSQETLKRDSQSNLAEFVRTTSTNLPRFQSHFPPLSHETIKTLYFFVIWLIISHCFTSKIYCFTILFGFK